MEGTFTDPRDGHVYKTVEIHGLTWMAENLDFNIISHDKWGNKAELGCYYENDESYKKYGRLYTWHEALVLAPPGWHLPTKEEWEMLGDDATKLKSRNGWDGNGTDEYGFNALVGGYGYSDGDFNGVGKYGRWWSATEKDSDKAYHLYIYNDDNIAYCYDWFKDHRFSVRYVMD